MSYYKVQLLIKLCHLRFKDTFEHLTFSNFDRQICSSNKLNKAQAGTLRTNKSSGNQIMNEFSYNSNAIRGKMRL